MKQKPFSCFGYVLLANYYEKDFVFDVETSSDSETVLYFVKGHVVGRNKATGEVAAQHFPGTFLTNHIDMLYSTTAMEDTICFCFDPKTNKGYLPTIKKFELSAGNFTNMPNGTKIFLCEGTVRIGDKEFTGPYQIRLNTGEKRFTASSNVYGLIFE